MTFRDLMKDETRMSRECPETKKIIIYKEEKEEDEEERIDAGKGNSPSSKVLKFRTLCLKECYQILLGEL